MDGLRKITLTALACGAVVVAFTACGTGRRGQARLPNPQDSVATGYGMESKATSGAATTITPKSKADESITIEQWLTRVPGVEVIRLGNGDFTLKVRGASSFYMNTEPLIVVDGTPMPAGGLRSALGGLNPRDIARVDVLKEGDTTLYGSRGGNGVIVITTKKGGRTDIR